MRKKLVARSVESSCRVEGIIVTSSSYIDISRRNNKKFMVLLKPDVVVLKVKIILNNIDNSDAYLLNYILTTPATPLINADQGGFLYLNL